MHFNFPIVQPSNAPSLPNFGSRYIFACSMQNKGNITLKSSRQWKRSVLKIKNTYSGSSVEMLYLQYDKLYNLDYNKLFAFNYFSIGKQHMSITVLVPHVQLWPSWYHMSNYDHLSTTCRIMTILVPHVNLWPSYYHMSIYDHFSTICEIMTILLPHVKLWLS